jgi:hypothetical protein
LPPQDTIRKETSEKTINLPRTFIASSLNKVQDKYKPRLNSGSNFMDFRDKKRNLICEGVAHMNRTPIKLNVFFRKLPVINEYKRL